VRTDRGKSHALVKAERDVRRREAALGSSEDSAAKWAQRLDRDRQALIDARRDLASAEGRLSDRATDEVLFRAIQRQLLQDKALRDTAVAVHVEDGRVTLTGRVPEAKLRARAEASIARARGVKSLENRIEVTRPPAES